VRVNFKIQGLPVVEQMLKYRRVEGAKIQNYRVIVGYSAYYAIYVHEDLTKNHKVGEAKFLENAAKVMENTLAQHVGNAVANMTDPPLAMLQAGYMLLEESNRRVPVDTGFLKSTGEVRIA
jgi:hypothetical protein